LTTFALFLAELAGTASIWAAIAAGTIASRCAYERLGRKLASPTAKRLRVRGRRVYQLLLDGAQPEAVRQRAAQCLLDAYGRERMLRDASGTGRLVGRWRRAGAWQVLHRTTAVDLHPMLETTLAGRDPLLQQAAVSMLGTLGDRRAAEILVEALEARRHTAECLVMQLHRFDPQTSAGVLMPLLDAADPTVRFWSISLLSRSRLDGVDMQLGLYARDPDAKVRKAVAQAMGEIGSERACAIAVGLLSDAEGFVRAHAVRALHKIGRDHKRSFAALVEPMKDDRDWWVRLAVRELLADSLPRGLQLVDEEWNVAPPLRPVAGWLTPGGGRHTGRPEDLTWMQ
jgi:HEAT repeat protein